MRISHATRNNGINRGSEFLSILTIAPIAVNEVPLWGRLLTCGGLAIRLQMPISYTTSYMAQITIYLPDALEKKARKTAKAQGKSVSRWVANQIERNLEDRWPQAVIDAAGAIPDFPDLEEIRKGYGSDAPREPLD